MQRREWCRHTHGLGFISVLHICTWGIHLCSPAGEWGEIHSARAQFSHPKVQNTAVKTHFILLGLTVKMETSLSVRAAMQRRQGCQSPLLETESSQEEVSFCTFHGFDVTASVSPPGCCEWQGSGRAGPLVSSTGLFALKWDKVGHWAGWVADTAGTGSLHMEVYRKNKESKGNNAHHKMGVISVKGPEGIHKVTTEYWKRKRLH